ncbi:MAG: PQQ-dependent sugar dehydrogenase [Methylococcales bacterium]|nr:PQQ-dependent sugar dehydrogenase [Methylococcales bacterium]
MKPFFRQLLYTLAALGIIWFFLPERYAVNVPLGLLGPRNWPSVDNPLEKRLHVPDGFTIRLYASKLRDARALKLTQTGDLLVSLPRSGTIVLLETDRDNDGYSDGRDQLVTGLNRPHGVDLHDGWLYVAETNAIRRVRFDQQSRMIHGDVETVVTGIPAGGNHWTRSLRFGPDGWMYLSVGSSCNACIETNPWRATILRFRPDGSDGEIYATGLRNTVGFDWKPNTGELYGVDIGRDFLGDDLPPDELNRIERGSFHGWPYVNGNRVADPDLGNSRQTETDKSIRPSHEFRAHSTPLNIHFLQSKTFPNGYKDAALVTLHGSWNRTEKQGYEVVSLHFGKDGTISERKFISGFEIEGNVIGRPVDIAESADGTLFISDDFSGSIYAITHGNGVTELY